MVVPIVFFSFKQSTPTPTIVFILLTTYSLNINPPHIHIRVGIWYSLWISNFQIVLILFEYYVIVKFKDKDITFWYLEDLKKDILKWYPVKDIRIFRISAQQHWFGFENKRQLQTYKNSRPRGPHLKSNPIQRIV
jgi:hypothetical protein